MPRIRSQIALRIAAENAGLTPAAANSNVKPRKVDDAYNNLKHLIITLQLAPGSPLDERILMEQLNIGRTPLREAIQRLVHEHLVVLRPRRGYYVSDLSLSDFQDMTAARELIEPEVARLAARNINADEVCQLRAMMNATLDDFDSLDIVGIAYRDLALHSAIAMASRNRYLATDVIEINTLMLRYWYITLSRAERAGELKGDYRRHHHLIDLLEQREEAAIFDFMLEHIAIFRRRMGEAIAAGITLRES